MSATAAQAPSRELMWDIKTPYRKMRTALIQVGLVIGLPFGALVAFLLYGYFVHGEQGGLYGAVMILVTLALVPPVMWLLYGGTYDLHIEMTENGIVCENAPRQANRTRWVAGLTILLQTLSKRPAYGAMSAAYVSTSRLRTDIAWKNIKSVSCNPKTGEIIIREKYMRQTALYCTEDNYETAVRFMADHLPSSAFRVRG